MQGETDCKRENDALNYEENLLKAISLVRGELDLEALPWLIYKLPNWLDLERLPYSSVVRNAQEKVSLMVPATSCYSSDSFTRLPDNVHLDYKGQVKSGLAAFEALRKQGPK